MFLNEKKYPQEEHENTFVETFLNSKPAEFRSGGIKKIKEYNVSCYV